jgi:hypothetical protein
MNAKRILFLVGIILGLVFPIYVHAATTLTVTPITWNVIGLDSNSPTSGPKYFPVGVRVCSSVATTNVAVNFVWDSANANINLRAGSLSSITIASIAANGCSDAYFEVEVNQVAGAYDTTRQYHITATDTSGTASSPTPRELYVEHLVSQSRNGITAVSYKLASGSTYIPVPAGGSMNLIINDTYNIKLEGFTATQGYNQLESFINFPNTIFQVLSVSTTYSADDASTSPPCPYPCVSNPNDKLYADACGWQNNPNILNYRTCVGGDYKAGGTVVTMYTVKIISGGGTSQTLNSLFQDFSGSSFHYNSDFSTGSRIANIIDPTSLTFSKNFLPNPTNTTTGSMLTFTISNPNAGAVSGLNFTDVFPTNMTVSGKAIAGTVAVTNGSPTVNGTGTTFTQLTQGDIVAINGVSYAVLSIGSTTQLTLTTNYAGTTASGLTISRIGGTTCGGSLTNNSGGALSIGNAGVGLPSGTVPANGNCVVTVNVAVSATATYNNTSGNLYVDTLNTNKTAIASLVVNFNTPASPAPSSCANPVEIARWDFSNYTASASTNNGPFAYSFKTTDVSSAAANYGSGNGSSSGIASSATWPTGWPAPSTGIVDNVWGISMGWAVSLTPSGSTTPYFEFQIDTSQYGGVGITASYDLEASGDWSQGANWYVLSNDGTGWSTAATIPWASSQKGKWQIGSLTSQAAITGTNTTSFRLEVDGAKSSGSPTPTVYIDNVIITGCPRPKPPVISKRFAPNPILAGGTSTLTFTITNPNPSDPLSGVAFSDTFPGTMTVASPLTTTNSCGGTLYNSGGSTALVAGDGSIRLGSSTGTNTGTISAGGSCTITVKVTATATGINTSGVVSATGTLNGNTASDTLTVKAPTPKIAILKQVSTSSSGPWVTALALSTGDSVYYKFTIENTGDVALNPVSVSDPTLAASSVDPATCSWTTPLPVASLTQDPTETCVNGPISAAAGDHDNTATASGTYSSTSYTSSPSTAIYSTTNFTRVYLSDFRAFEQNGQIVVEWTTASEHNTLGFYLMRLNSNTQQYQSVAEGLLPSMFTEANGGIYSLIDKEALAGQTYQYKLIEVERNGRKITYGPFKVSALEKENASSTMDISSLRSLSKESLSQTAEYTRRAKMLSTVQETLLQARTMSGKAAIEIKQNNLTLIKGSRIKIPIEEDGLYYIDANEISAITGAKYATVKSMIGSKLLSVRNQGQPVAYLPAQGNSGIYFYATGIDSAYTRDNVYWIDMGRGTTMTNEKTSAPVSSNPDAAFTDDMHIEKDLIQNMGQTDNPAEDYWNWDLIFLSSYYSDGPKNFKFSLNGKADTQTTATLQVHLVGGSDTGINPDHHVKVKLNGQQIAEGWWQGLNLYTLTATFDQSLLNEGQNTIEVQGILNAGLPNIPDIPYSMFLIDSFDLTYERLYEAVDNRLFFTGDGNQIVTVRGFATPTPDILLLNVTNPEKPKLNTSALIKGSPGNYEISFKPVSPDARYLAITRDATVNPTNMLGVNPSSLKKRYNMVDYLIIVPEELETAVQPLSSYRRAQGMRTMVVKLDDIMNEFNFGISSPEAIKQFLTYAYYNWIKLPKYVVLAGVGTWDYKNNKGKGGNLIPPALVPTAYGLSTSDNYFADVNGDHVPKMAIGRLPVLTPEELQIVIGKIKTFEATADNRAILVADDPDDGGNFPVDSEIIAHLFPSRYRPLEKVYLGEYLSVDAARIPLLNYLNSGAKFFNYIGHASFDIFAMLDDEALLTSDDVASLTNATKLPIVTAMTCLPGEFAIPGYPTISQVMLLNTGGGAAAFWSATGLSDNTEAHILNREFYNAIFNSGKRILGDAVLQALEQYRMSGATPFMMDIYTILGDPALRVK